MILLLAHILEADMAKKHLSVTQVMEKILVIYIILNPLIDLFTGLYLREVVGATELDVYTASFASTPSLIIRMLMLVIFALYLLVSKDRLAISTLVLMGLAFCASVGVLLLTGAKLSLGTDIKYFVKYAYNIVMFFAYMGLIRSMCKDKAEFMKKAFTVIRYTCIVCALGIIIPYIFSLGYYTYADRMGMRGCRGYFYSGNDITAVFTLLLPICAAGFISSEKPMLSRDSLVSVFATAITVIALLLIGSKTAFIAAIGTCALLLLYTLVRFAVKHGKDYLIRMLFLLLVIVVFFLLLALIVGFDRITDDVMLSFYTPTILAEQENVEVAVLSGRSDKLAAQLAMYKDGGVITWLFGIGRSIVQNIIEMDVFEVIVYYGIVGAAAMLWIYVWLAVSFFKSLFRRFNIVSFALLIALGMCAGYLILAGHVLFSVTSGQYFVFVIAFSRLYFAKSAEEAQPRPRLMSKLLKL